MSSATPHASLPWLALKALMPLTTGAP